MELADAVNSTVEVPAATMIQAGTERRLLLTVMARACPPLLAGVDRTTVQADEPPGEMTEAMQLRSLISVIWVCGVMVIEEVLAIPLALAVTMTAVLATTVEAETAKTAEVVFARTVTVAGRVRAALLEVRVTTCPAAGAAAERVIVQEAAPPAGMEAGRQERMLGTGNPVTVMEAVFEAPLAVAVTTTGALTVTEAAVTEKEAEVAPAATVTEAGVVRTALLSERVTSWPPAGAAAESVMVQEEEPPELMEAGEHDSVPGTGKEVTVTEAVLEVPLAIAVTTTAVLAVTEPAVTEKAAEVAPAATVTEAGVVSAALLSERVTSWPPVGAAAESVTVQEADPPEVREAGKHERVLGMGRALMVTEAVLEAPLAAAVMTTAVFAVTEVAVTVKAAEVAPLATVTEAGVVSALLSSERVTN